MKYLIYLFWITVYSRNSRIRWALDGISRGQRRFLLGLIVLLIIGQLSQSSYPIYPLVYWGMYSKVGHLGQVYDYTGIRADGSEFRLPMTDLIRTHSKSFVWRTRSSRRCPRATTPSSGSGARSCPVGSGSASRLRGQYSRTPRY